MMTHTELTEITQQDQWEDFLAGLNSGKSVLNFSKYHVVVSQGDPADEVYYIQKGKIKITVVSVTGKEATLSILGSRDFLGICCLSETVQERLSTASALEPSQLVRIKKD